MKNINSRFVYIIGVALSLGVLGLMLLFAHAFIYEAPYAGFYFNGTDGRIVEFYGKSVSQDVLQTGDILKKVGDVTLTEYLEDNTVYFFKDALPGDAVPMTVVRNGVDVNLAWVFPGYTPEEFSARFRNPWWMGFLFWAFGLAIQLFMRPRDVRWRLLIALNEATGAWFLLGVASSLRVWNSSVFFHAITWTALPIYLHLHWIFPNPLKRLPSWFGMGLYLFCGALFLGELFHLLPLTAYYFGVLLMFGGSIVLLFLHLRKPQDRRAVQLLLLSFGVALLPAIILSLVGLGGNIPERGLIGMLALPFMPAAYTFLIFRRQSGGIEARASRWFSVYGFFILLGTFLVILTGWATVEGVSPIVAVIVTGLLAAYISMAAFPTFQAFVNRRVLGIKLPYQNLPEAYSSRIATSASITSLLQLVDEAVFPSLLVRQYAFIELSGNEARSLLVRGLDAGQLPNLNEAHALTSLAGRFILPEDGQPHPWIRLILSLKVGDNLLGLWLLGRRDPDDLYHATEIPIFQSLADQTAIAMSNLLQTDRLRLLYQMDIERGEQERKRLARELHDSVLNQLAVLRMNMGETDPSPQFNEAYEEVISRLREIVSDLRPPMLNYGLKLALEEFAQNAMDHGQDRAQVSFTLSGSAERYPPNIELHLFRIVQEACENALRHANADKVIIRANMEPSNLHIEIEDDGDGFEVGERMDLDGLLLRSHFGLVGIVERANLIGAQASIHSAPEAGTRVSVHWRAAAEGQG